MNVKLSIAGLASFLLCSSVLPAEDYVVPRTEWDQPDLQGVWNFSSDIPLQRPSQYGEREYLTEEEIAGFEKLREEFMSNPVATNFLDAQEEVQKVQDRIHQVIAKTFEIGRVPQQEDFDFCSDGFGDCGCSHE